jgi:hypothetical protein
VYSRMSPRIAGEVSHRTSIRCIPPIPLSLLFSALLVWVIQSRFGCDEPRVLFMPGRSPLETPYRTNHALVMAGEGDTGEG